MKKIRYVFFISCTLGVMLGCSTDAEMGLEEQIPNEIGVATTEIGDRAFEQALIDLNFDEVLDGAIVDSRVNSVTNLNLDGLGITSLSGIEAFENLENLSVRGNQLMTLDVSRNSKLKFVWAEDNQLANLVANGLPIIEKIGADNNQLSVFNPSGLTTLQYLGLSNNRLGSINVSNNLALTDFFIAENPLSCIQVNPEQLANPPSDWDKDENDILSLDCQ